MSKPGVLGVFGHIDAAVDAIKELRDSGHDDLTVFSPVPRHELEDALAQPTSPVRMWTLVGGLAGLATGTWLTIWTSLDWPLVVGGKPIASIAPYVIIMFELTVLFGALSTLAGLAFNVLFAWQKGGAVLYDPRCSDDKIGVFVACEGAVQEEMKGLLTGTGAEEVRVA